MSFNLPGEGGPSYVAPSATSGRRVALISVSVLTLILSIGLGFFASDPADGFGSFQVLWLAIGALLLVTLGIGSFHWSQGTKVLLGIVGSVMLAIGIWVGFFPRSTGGLQGEWYHLRWIAAIVAIGCALYAPIRRDAD